MEKSVDSWFEEHMKGTMTSSTREASSLDLNELLKMMKIMDRYSKIYFMACNYLPDDCYGIMYVRPEDVPKKSTVGEK